MGGDVILVGMALCLGGTRLYAERD
jgi:hypothetical protein